jgi:CRISPR-associated protein Csb1
MPNRTVIHVPLAPVAGARFQPTGFPDLGTGVFEKPAKDGWITAILVESEQSMANHLEGTGWDRAENKPVPSFSGLPYVQVNNVGGDYLTSSRTEAHRLASAFIREGTFVDKRLGVQFFNDELRLAADKPMSARDVAKAIFAIDPACLVHGVFFADNKIHGQPKIARALTSFVEAEDVRAAEYGGVKKDEVTHKNSDGQGSSEGFGSIPFHRTLWTARTITATFVLDLDQIKSYGLSENATRLVEVIALWEIRTLLDAGLRLRTMCDLTPIHESIPNLPSASELDRELKELSASLAGELSGGTVRIATWSKGKKSEK